MNAEKFIASLKAAAPSQKQLRVLGISRNDADEIRSAFVSELSNKRVRADISDQVLCDLVSNFDLSTLEIGPLRFERPPIEYDDHWVFARFDEDSVALVKETGRVVVLDQHEVSQVLWNVADSGAEFLDALLETGRFLSRCIVDPDLYDDTEAAANCATSSAELSGCMENVTFYRMFFGV